MTDIGVVFRAVDTDLQLLQFTASFIGASAVRPVGLQPSGSLFNYYLGDPAQWRQNVTSYEVIAYEGLYEGVDLRIQGLRSHVKYEFHVAPGADYSQIAVHYEGIEGLSIAEDGSLQVNLGAGRGVIRDDAPYIYQEIDGQKVEAAGHFVLLDDRTYSFEITGTIDPDHALVIDPDIIWSTYLGGGNQGSCTDVTVDVSGNVYITGSTAAPGSLTGGFDTTANGGSDAFVVKFNSNGEYLWGTYLGGSNDDASFGIALDASGAVYVTGSTDSPDWTSGGFDTTYNGSRDAFVAKLGSGGQHLWSTYLGGGNADYGYDVATDASGAAYATGFTYSSDWVSEGYDQTYNGKGDAFVAKLSSGGDHLWSTYIGGGSLDDAQGIAVDASGAVYVAGGTCSPGWTAGGFNVTAGFGTSESDLYFDGERFWYDYPGWVNVSPGGGPDAFVAKLNSNGQPLWSTYLGGVNWDFAYGIALDTSGAVYVTGYTESVEWTSSGAALGYVGDAFVSRLSSDGQHFWTIGLEYMTTGLTLWCGNSGQDVAVSASGTVYVTGHTESGEWTSGGSDSIYHGGSSDAFVAKVSPEGEYLWSICLGGNDVDEGKGIAVDASGDVYVAGLTKSAGWTVGGYCTTSDSGSDGFLVKLSDLPDTVPPTIGSFSVSPALIGLGDAFTIAYTISDSGGSGLGRIELWRTDNPDSWSTEPVAQKSARANGPLSGAFSDTPPSIGDWWYSVRVFDSAGNPAAEPQPIHVVVGPPDLTPPSPDPSTWDTEPYATGDRSIRMVATTATDLIGVQYYFHCLTPGGHDSYWQDSNTYEDTRLLPSTTYTYQVKARDKSVAQNETGYSVSCTATTLPDTTPPTPNPTQWQTAPFAIRSTSVWMIAMPASDISGVEYCFEEISGNAGGADSGWQDSDLYMSTELVPNTAYVYRVKTRDKSLAHNETDYSPAYSVTTPAPPAPDPGVWLVAPYATSSTSISMTARDSDAFVYYFHCLTPGGHDSGWLEHPTYEDTGLSPGTSYMYQVKTRDTYIGGIPDNPYSDPAVATTPSPVYRFWSPVLQRHFYTIKEGEKTSFSTTTRTSGPMSRWRTTPLPAPRIRARRPSIASGHPRSRPTSTRSVRARRTSSSTTSRMCGRTKAWLSTPIQWRHTLRAQARSIASGPAALISTRSVPSSATSS